MRRARRVSPPASPHQAASNIKIALLGRGGVGKSALTVRYLCRRFLTEYDPTLEDTYVKETEVDGRPVRLHILDTAGEVSKTDFFTRTQQLKAMDAFMIVFSVTDRMTFRAVRDHLTLISACQRELFEQTRGCRQPVVILVGNKTDLSERREVEFNEASKFGEQFGIPYVETSAADDDHSVRRAFHACYRLASRAGGEKPLTKKTSSSLFDLNRLPFRKERSSRVIHITV